MSTKAWDVLTEDEKLAITLSINHQKSTWEAGEIMGKAHYKYLEIQARAKMFYKMFTEYYKLTDDLLIPKGLCMDQDVAEFFRLTIEKRLGHRAAIKELGNSVLAINSAKDRMITEYVNQLLVDEHPQAVPLYDLIMDFDRWNNFRILPLAIQEPSAFKRRNKTRLIKHLSNLKRLNPYHLDRFTERFKYKKGQLNPLYLPMISDMYKDGYKVEKIAGKKDVIEFLSKKFRLYIFKKEEDAETYGYLVEGYLGNDDKSCRHGQIFWPKFRSIIKKASNYDDVNNIIPRRKYLEVAFRDLDSILNKKRKDKPDKDMKGDPAARVSPESLWGI